MADGSKAVGTANIRHILTDKRIPMTDDQPGYGTQIVGFVKCRIVKKHEDGSVEVDVPSFDLIRVSHDVLAEMV